MAWPENIFVAIRRHWLYDLTKCNLRCQDHSTATGGLQVGGALLLFLRGKEHWSHLVGRTGVGVGDSKVNSLRRFLGSIHLSRTKVEWLSFPETSPLTALCKGHCKHSEHSLSVPLIGSAAVLQSCTDTAVTEAQLLLNFTSSFPFLFLFFFLLLKKLFIYVFGCLACMYICTLEEGIKSHHVGGGNWTQDL